jgi:large subunit ribosomal protein L9e
MRFAYAHFPILVTVSEDKKHIEVKNFLGEKRPRTVHLVEGVTAVRSANVKDEIVLDGIDNEMVGLSGILFILLIIFNNNIFYY